MQGIHCSDCDTINAMPVDDCEHCGRELDPARVLNFCDMPECDREAVKRDHYCRFHLLLHRQRLGVNVSERELEAAFMEG